VIGYHTTSPERLARIQAEGLVGDLAHAVYTYDRWQTLHRQLHGERHPVYVALERPLLLDLPGRHNVSQDELVTLELDLAGIALHADLPMMSIEFPAFESYGQWFSLTPWRGDLSSGDQRLRELLVEITGESEGDTWATDWLADKRVRELICNALQTACTSDPIGPERIIAVHPYRELLEAAA
jgi:hypothetical protein